MAEGYLVIEDIPNSCKKCIFRSVTDSGYEYCCTPNLGFDYSVTEKDIGIGKRKPDWCPIKTFSDTQFVGYSGDEYSDGWDAGWDSCLGHIRGYANER